MEYIGINENRSVSDLSSVALIINDKNIDELIDGYRTLKVSGRETLSNELEPESTHEGSIIVDERLPARELTITYAMEAEDNQTLQNKFKELRKLLTGDLKVTFLDEGGTFYFGKLSTMEIPPDDSRHFVSSFTIHCPSPFKYGSLIITNGSVPIDTFYNPRPEEIILNVHTTVNNLKISDGNHTISATGTFNEGSEVVLNFNKENMTLKVNGVESTYMIDLNSDFENFYIKHGINLTSSQGSLSVKMRERWL